MHLALAKQMKGKDFPSPSAAGFTLLEVLAALALCVLLASVTASAVIHSGSATRRSTRLRDQALQLSFLYARARLRPADLSADFPSPWRVALDEKLTTSAPPPPVFPDRPLHEPPPPRRWILLTLHAPASEALLPVQLAILENSTP